MIRSRGQRGEGGIISEGENNISRSVRAGMRKGAVGGWKSEGKELT